MDTNDQQQYEAWRTERARAEVPEGFADRVMASIHQARQRAWWGLTQRMTAAAWRSRIVRAGLYGLALVVCAMRVGFVLTIFLPQ